MQLKKIPKEEHSNVIAVYWMMMRQLEEDARSSGSAFDKLQVEGFYMLWNRITGDNKVPHWMQEAK